MTDETAHPPLEETLDNIFGLVSHLPPLAAKRAAHDYTQQHIIPTTNTLNHHLEKAFIAGAHWALTNQVRKEQQ